MKHYTSIIKKYGVTQWKRSLLTIIGITLSVSLMSFSVIFIQNLKETIFHSAKYSTGYYHMAVLQPNEEQESVLRLYQKVNIAGKVTTKTIQLPNTDSSIQLMSLDNGARKIFKEITLVKGKLPINEKGIVLEEWIVQENGMEVGDEIRLGDIPLELVGVCKNQFNSRSNKSSIGYLVENHSLLSSNGTKSILYIQFHEQLINKQDDFELNIRQLTNAAGVSEDNVQRNSIVYKALGEYTSSDYPSIFIISVNLLVMGLFIFNTYQISVMERIQHYGILRSLGATPRQIHYLVLNEAMVFSVVAVPIGIGLGIALQRLIQYLSFFDNAPKLTVPFWDVLWVGVIAFITILFSVYKPAVAASKVSPIQAIKMTQELNQLKSTENEQTHFLLNRFGVSAHLAWQNILRNRSRFLGATLSMSVAIVLIILNFGFFSSQDPAALVKHNYLWNSNYYVTSEDGFKKNEINQLKEIFPKIKVIASKYDNIEASLMNGDSMDICFHGYHEKELKKANHYVISGSVDIDHLQSEEEIILVVPRKNQSDFRIGDSIKIKFKEKLLFVKIGAIVENYPTVGDRDRIKMVGHTNLFESLIGNKRTYNRLDLTIEESSENHSKIFKKLDAFVADGKVRSLYENMESIKEDFDVFQLLMMGFICTIGLIGLFSIYNTLATSYLIRKNEFGILRAIGMTSTQLREMVIWEGLYYGLFSTVWGILMGITLHYLQYKILNVFVKEIYPSWDFPYEVSIIAGITCIGICICTSMFSSKKIKLTNIIDLIKIVN
ncbi:FtsX-like permease family protein [Priestia megaterium]|nr:FtsX-like permease family protein [Priestia megaterium]